jgi:hypothetical protein
MATSQQGDCAAELLHAEGDEDNPTTGGDWKFELASYRACSLIVRHDTVLWQ